MSTVKDSRINRRLLIAAALAGPLAAGLWMTPAAAQDAETFFHGKTVTIFVGFSPGGGYDLYARLAADFLGRHIPGNPQIIVQNMPGGGGRVAAQYVANVAPQDGTALSVVVQSVAMDSAIGAIPGGLDARALNAIGRMTANYELGIVWQESAAKTFEDTKTTEVTFASTGAGSASSFVPQMLNDIEGTQFRVIQGYEGTSAATLAMEQREVDGAMIGVAGLTASKPDWISKGRVNVVWQLSTTPHPDFPDVPAVGEMGQDEDQKAMLRLVAGAADIGRSLVAPPNVPEDRIEALRRAFDAMMADPEFQSEAATRRQELDPANGEELQAIIKAQMDVSPEAIEMTRSYVVGQ